MINVPLVFLDTETTGLSWDRQTWEIAIIRDNPDGTTKEWQAFLPVSTEAGEWNEESLSIGKFYQRYPGWDGDIADPYDAANMIYEMTKGAHIVGMCPDFDAFNLWKLLKAAGIKNEGISDFPWYYQLIDVDMIAAGALIGTGEIVLLPINTEYVCEYFDVPQPSDEDRHTAMGDAKWTRELYYAITNR